MIFCRHIPGRALARWSVLCAILLIWAETALGQTIDAVYFAQTHVQEATHPYLNLVGNRETLIKAHVIAPGSVSAPAVEAVLTLDGQTLRLPLTGPPILPLSIPKDPGIVQHSFENSFTGYIPKAWVKRGLSVTIAAGPARASFNNLQIGAPTRVIMTMFDVHYFALASGNYPTGWQEELEAKWPVASLELRRLPRVIFPELVIPPRPDVGTRAVRVKSRADYRTQTGLNFDGEQAAALAWNDALKAAAGTAGRVSLYYTNIYGVPAGGQAGGFAGVGSGTSIGVLHHELGHAFSLPHWGDNSAYPYKRAMHGIPAPAIYNETHAGPTWGFDLRKKAFIPCTVQVGNAGNKPIGTYKADPMQGGGDGWQEKPYLMNHFSDYSCRQMRNYLNGHVLAWNDAQESYASWNASTRDYTNTVTNNGVQYPLVRDVPVISIMASVSGSNPDVSMVYPPIGPYVTGLINRFDPSVAADRTAAAATFSPPGGCDVSLRIVQGGVQKTYMLAAAWEPSQSPFARASLRTAALNLPADDGEVTRVDLLLTPDAQINGLPADPQVLYTWPTNLIAAPSGLKATNGDGEVGLSWAPAADATAYIIKRSTTSGGPFTQIGTSTATNFSDSLVTTGLSYFYVVVAQNAFGESPESMEAGIVVQRLRFWDGGTIDITENGNGASAGGAGTWDTTLRNWDAGLSEHVAWNNPTNDTAIFAGTGAAITVGVPITVGGVRLNTNGYTFSGSPVSIATGGLFTGPAGFTHNFAGFALAAGNTTYRFKSSNATTDGFANNKVFTMSGNLTGAGNSVVISGTQPVYLTGTNNYGGGTIVDEGAALGFDQANITGLPASSVSVGLNSSILRRSTTNANTLNNTFLQRLATTENAFTIYVNNGPLSSDLDLSGANGGRSLPNASLAFWDNVGTSSFAFTGVITPADDTYRFGGAKATNIINLPNTNALTGARTLVVDGASAVRVRLHGPNDYSGETLIRAGTLMILNQLALQNSPINTAGDGTIDVSGNRVGLNPTTATPVTSPVIGGLIGSKDITSVFASYTATTTGTPGVTSLTLNPGADMTDSYSGVITDGAPGMALIKTGAGTQVMTGENLYTGPTIINAGILMIADPGSLAVESAVSVAGGTLAGDGSIGGSITVETGGSLIPGVSLESLQVYGDTCEHCGKLLEVDPDASSGTLSVGGDLDISAMAAGGSGRILINFSSSNTNSDIDVTGMLKIGDGVLDFEDFDFISQNDFEIGTYKLVTAGSISGGLTPGAASGGTINGLEAALQITGNDLELVVTAASIDDYQNWAANYPGIDLSNPDEDFDGDGLINDHERIWGLDPTSGASASAINVAPDLASGTFSYTRRHEALTLMNFTIWTSTDLLVWTEDTDALQTPSPLVDQVETVAVSLSPARLTGDRLFIQVRAAP